MSKIIDIKAREILDSRGNPTVEVEVHTSQGNTGRAAVPSGASTGAHEAHELRDGDPKRYGGKGVKKAVDNILRTIAPALKGFEISDQSRLDQTLIELDGEPNKSRLGANAILGVSLASAKASALDAKNSLFKNLGGDSARKLPVPLMNILNGGAHADNGLDVQEFMIAPVVGGRFSEALRAGAEVFHALKKILNARGLSTGIGDEGGFAPKLKNNREALDLISTAVGNAGYRLGQDIYFALDVAATELFDGTHYRWDGKKITGLELSAEYSQWASSYPIISIEDGFSEDDWPSWEHFTKLQGAKLQLVGDDLFVTNPKRIAMGIERKAANALLVKPNQIGTLTETREAIELARKAGFKTVMSHRSGETEDAIIADLCVGFGCEQIKTGSLCRGERTAKYNQLLRIEEELGSRSEFWGARAFRSI
jgi:enolase